MEIIAIINRHLIFSCSTFRTLLPLTNPYTQQSPLSFLQILTKPIYIIQFDPYKYQEKETIVDSRCGY